MSNDMKLIMEAWRKTLSEVGYQDVGPGSSPTYDSDGNPIYTMLKYPKWLEIGVYWAARILDPTGIMSWEDLVASWNKYITAIENQEDPFTLKNMKTNFENAFYVALNAVDSIPVVAFAAKPATVPLEAARGMRAISSELTTAGFPKLAAEASNAARKLESKGARRLFLQQMKKADSILYGVYSLASGGFSRKISNSLITKFPSLDKLPSGQSAFVTATLAFAGYYLYNDFLKPLLAIDEITNSEMDKHKLEALAAWPEIEDEMRARDTGILTEEEFERTVYEAKMEYYNAVETLSKELEQMEEEVEKTEE